LENQIGDLSSKNQSLNLLVTELNALRGIVTERNNIQKDLD
jgi:hypothetical protein